jgi:hypothetical protein
LTDDGRSDGERFATTTFGSAGRRDKCRFGSQSDCFGAVVQLAVAPSSDGAVADGVSATNRTASDNVL